MIKNRIKEFRARHDMKQEDLAKLVGVRRETIGNLEKGRYNPSLVLAWNIAEVFGVSIEDRTADKGKPVRTDLTFR